MIIHFDQLEFGLNDVRQEVDYSGMPLFNEFHFKEPVSLNLRIQKEKNEIYIRGSAAVLVESVCDRCLRSCDRQLSGELMVTLKRLPVVTDVRSEPETDEIVYISEEEKKIELNEIVHESLLLSLPMKFVCKEDCRGICPHCGNDLNVRQCQCVHIENPADERWQALNNI